MQKKPISEYPIAIVGGGIAGLALAIALDKHGIASVVLERDASFETRHQGYGLTLQQGGRALNALGLVDAVREQSRTSRSHCIFDHHGNVVMAWAPQISKNSKEAGKDGGAGGGKWSTGRNGHVPRQALRRVLLDAAMQCKHVCVLWDAKLRDIEVTEPSHSHLVLLQLEGRQDPIVARAVVGCDGIHSTVRKRLFAHIVDPLVPLHALVVLGITEACPLLVERIVQMSDGHTRIFAMPFDQDRCMWQLSFRLDPESDLAVRDRRQWTAPALKAMILERCGTWAEPIPELLRSTQEDCITGYPVFDRDPLDAFPVPADLPITLIGDAAHPMSPFKGQGANQALLDAVELASMLSQSLHNIPQAFRSHEQWMLKRTRAKVLQSREAVDSLHDPEFLDTEFQLTRRGYSEQACQQELEKMAELRKRSVGCGDPPALDAALAELFGDGPPVDKDITK